MQTDSNQCSWLNQFVLDLNSNRNLKRWPKRTVAGEQKRLQRDGGADGIISSNVKEDQTLPWNVHHQKTQPHSVHTIEKLQHQKRASQIFVFIHCCLKPACYHRFNAMKSSQIFNTGFEDVTRMLTNNKCRTTPCVNASWLQPMFLVKPIRYGLEFQ